MYVENSTQRIIAGCSITKLSWLIKPIKQSTDVETVLRVTTADGYILEFSAEEVAQLKKFLRGE